MKERRLKLEEALHRPIIGELVQTQEWSEMQVGEVCWSLYALVRRYSRQEALRL